MLILSSCGSGNDENVATNENDATNEVAETTQDVNQVQETPKTVEERAKGYLSAMKSKNLEEVKTYQMKAEAIQTNQERVDNVSDEYVKDWDGTIKEVRYGYALGSADIPMAYVYYGDVIPVDTANPQYLVVTFMRPKKTWRSWEFKEMTQDEFTALSTEILQKEVSE